MKSLLDGCVTWSSGAGSGRPQRTGSRAAGQIPGSRAEARTADPLVERFPQHHLPRLRELYDPQLVLVFGSRARGDALAESDLDLVLVSERFKDEPFILRATTVLRDLDLPFGADILCYTPDEFARKREELGVLSAAIEEGLRLV